MNLTFIKQILILTFIVVLNAFLLYKLIFFPYPEFFIDPYLTNHGFTPYSQIIDQHFPGLMFLPLNFDNLGMRDPEAARVWFVGIVSLTHIFIFLVSRKLFKNNLFVLFPNLIYLIWQPYLEGWVFWIDSIMPLFYLPMFYIAYEIFFEDKSSSKRIIALGFFCSLAILFKQIALPLTAVLFLLIWFKFKKTKKLGYFIFGFFPVTALWIFYYFMLGAIYDFLYWTVWFNITTFAKYGRKGPSTGDLLKVLFIFAPMLGLFLTRDKKLTLLFLLFFLGALAGAFDRFDFVHFQPALPFLVIIFAYIISNIQINKKYLVFAFGYGLIAVYLLISFYKNSISDRVLFYDPETLEVARKIKSSTSSGQEIFLIGSSPHIYQLSDTIPAGKIFVFQFPWFMMVAEDRVLQAIEKNPPKLIVRDKTVEIEGKKITDYMRKTIAFTDKNYQKYDSVGNVEFLRLKD